MADAKKSAFKVGDRVSFLRSHDKTVRLEGHIARIHDNDDDCVDIETIPDGKIVEVSTIETAHTADVKLIEASKAAAVPAPITLTPHQEKFLESRGYKGTSEDHARFIAGLDEVERAGFFASADAWKEPDPEVNDPDKAAPAGAPADHPEPTD